MIPRATMCALRHAVSAIMIVALSGCREDAPPRPMEAPDENAPARVTDLRFRSFRDSSAVITWTAPGGDGVTGTAARYDVRIAPAPLTPPTWESATRLPSPSAPRSAGAAETLIVALRPLDSQVWIALNAADDAGNWSGLSNVVHIGTGELRWWNGFSTSNICCGSVSALLVHNGALFAGGDFRIRSGGAETPAVVAQWNGTSWDAADEIPSTSLVHALVVHDGELVAGAAVLQYGAEIGGGVYRRAADAWTPLGATADGGVHVLAVYRDRLFAAGDFEAVGDSSAAHIASWDGLSWRPLGTGLDGPVHALVVYQDRLIAGGDFSHAGGTIARGLAAWDGASWHPLGDGIEGVRVHALAVSNGTLYAGGWPEDGMDDLGLIAAWDGIGWTCLPGIAGYAIDAMADLGGDLIVACRPTYYWHLDDRVLRFDGASWRFLGDLTGSAGAIAVDGRRLYVGGDFDAVGPRVSPLVARWDE